MRCGVVVVLALGVLGAAGCSGSGEGSGAVPGGTSTVVVPASGASPAASPSTASSGASLGASSRTPAADPAISGPGTVCSTTEDGKVVINRGSVDCAEATSVATAIPHRGSGPTRSTGAWKCGWVGSIPASKDLEGYFVSCSRGSDSILRQPLDAPTAANWRTDLTPDSDPTFGTKFVTPTGKFHCGWVEIQGMWAGCHGDFPGKSTKGRPRPVDNNAVELDAESAAHYSYVGQPLYQHAEDRSQPPTLEYGESYYYGGFLFTSAESGLTCTHGAHGFRASTRDPAVW